MDFRDADKQLFTQPPLTRVELFDIFETLSVLHGNFQQKRRGEKKHSHFLKRQSNHVKSNLIRSVIKRLERLTDAHTHRGGNHHLTIKGRGERKPKRAGVDTAPRRFTLLPSQEP